MKNIILIIISFTHLALFAQVIQNGGFEDGPTANHISQIYKADFWDFGCDVNSNLYDCQATPVVGGPLNGQVVVGTPVTCINPRNNGSANCRFGSLRCKGGFSSSASLWNELSSNLLPNVNYEIQAHVARGNSTNPNSNLPLIRRIEVVLRSTNDANPICENEEIVVPVPVDITFINCNWMSISTTFQLTNAQAALGYKLIEFRELPLSGYDQELIFIDDVSLIRGTLGLPFKEKTTLSSESISIYPNPASLELYIETEVVFERIIIMDLMGKVLLETSYSNTICLESLSSGAYLIQLESGSEKFNQRFIKQ